MPPSKATPRTLEMLRSFGWYYWRVESFNAYSGRKTDLFNIIDYLVITPFSTIGIQSCAGDFAPHIRKLAEEEVDKTVAWLKCPNRQLYLIGWRKVLMRKGLKKRIYKPRVAIFYLNGDELIVEEKDTKWYGSQMGSK